MEKLLTRREPGVHELGPLRHRAGASSVHQAEAIDCRLDLAGGGGTVLLLLWWAQKQFLSCRNEPAIDQVIEVFKHIKKRICLHGGLPSNVGLEKWCGNGNIFMKGSSKN